MAQAPVRRVSAASLLETSIVLNRLWGPKVATLLDEFLSLAVVEVVPFSPAQSRLACQAYRRFGKGMGHPAQLNILDCCTYGLASESQEPLLFKGRDFDKTDLKLAVIL
jgi:ribonuclease VapC